MGCEWVVGLEWIAEGKGEYCDGLVVGDGEGAMNRARDE